MTYKKALQILIESAARDVMGMGLGYRTTTEKWRVKVREAISKVFPKAYDREMDYSDRYNLHIY